MLGSRPESDNTGSGQTQAQSFQERMMLYAKPIQPKPIKSRSRAGCKYCRDKRKKCSEDKPRCARCIQFGVECVYEPIKKRKKRTTKFTVPSPPEGGPTTSAEAGSSSATPPQPFTHGHHVELGESSEPPSQLDPWAGIGTDASMSDSTVTTSPSLLGFDDGLMTDNTYQLAAPPFDLSGSVCGTQAEVIPSLAWSPGIDEDLLPWPYLSGSVMWDEHLISAPQMMATNTADANHQLDLNVMGWMTGPSPMSGVMLQSLEPQHQQPPSQQQQHLNHEGLLDHFRESLSLGQSLGSGDPVVRHIAPLCYRSDVVREAACALAGAHLARTGARDDVDHISFYNEAMNRAAALAPFREIWDLEQALSALLLLLHYEVLVQRGQLNFVAQHLSQAWQILKLPLADDLPSVTFFKEAFRYFDTLNALSSDTIPMSSAPSTPVTESPPSSSSDKTAQLPKELDLSKSPLGLTTTLLSTLHGLADLNSLKHELDRASATGQSSEAALLRAEFDTSRAAIERALMAWEPTLPVGYTLVNRVVDGPEDAREAEVAAVRSAASRGLACKQAALTYLHRCIGGEAPGSEPVQRHARAALWHCVAAASSPYAAAAAAVASPGREHGQIGGGSGTGAGMLWPLFVSSIEATEGRDRGMARQAFAALEGVKGVVNASKAWEVVLEVWRRKDLARAGGGPDLGGQGWRRVAEEMGISLVFG